LDFGFSFDANPEPAAPFASGFRTPLLDGDIRVLGTVYYPRYAEGGAYVEMKRSDAANLLTANSEWRKALRTRTPGATSSQRVLMDATNVAGRLLLDRARRRRPLSAIGRASQFGFVRFEYLKSAI
jgi:hypothetical protein